MECCIVGSMVSNVLANVERSEMTLYEVPWLLFMNGCNFIHLLHVSCDASLKIKCV